VSTTDTSLWRQTWVVEKVGAGVGGPIAGEVLTGTGVGTSEWLPPTVAHDHSTGTFGTTLSPAGGLNLSSVISPAAISTDMAAYDPNGGDFAVLWRLTATGAPRTLSGIKAPLVGGAFHILTVLAGSEDIVLAHDTGGTSAADQILTPTLASLTLAAGARVVVVYDATAARWLVV
jgi:hypothetical protein